MTSVLIVDDDVPFGTALARVLTTRGFEVSVAHDVDEALAALARAPADVLLSDLRLGGRDGIDLLRAVRDAWSGTRSILMSAFASARDHQTAVQLGAVQVLCKPFTPAELFAAIQHAIECETGFRGSVHGLSLIDMLQMFHQARRSIVVVLDGAPGGSIHLREGEIVHADSGARRGEDALKALLATPSGSIHTTVLGDATRTIERPFFALVLDSLRQVDESSRGAGDAGALNEVWSQPSEKPPIDPWRGVRELLPRVAPDALAFALDVATGAVEPLQGEIDGVPWIEPLAALARDVGRLADWRALEHVGVDVAFALFRSARGGRLVVLSEALRGRYAALRFRSEVGRLVSWITASMEGEMDDGKDR